MITNRSTLATTAARELALDCIEVGLEASDPAHVLRSAVTLEQDILQIDGTDYDLALYDDIVVVGGGKASGRQAAALEDILGDRIDRGLVVTVEPFDLDHIDVRVGDHPVPSERGVDATGELLEVLADTNDRSLVIALITGGGSALLPAPAADISLDVLQSVTRELLESGASIDEINAVRKHLSALKGGAMARTASPARVVGVLMSDVVGNDRSVIASGPTVPDATTFRHAQEVLERYGISTDEAVTHRLANGANGAIAETPKPDDPIFDRVDNHIIADGTTPITAAVEYLDDRPYTAYWLSSRIRGEARDAAKSHVAIGEEMLATGNPVSPPAVLLSGGETTVTLRGDGRGGPNQEFALSAVIEGCEGLTLAAIDTDGIDGASPAAGGIVDGNTVTDEYAARSALANNDAYTYLVESSGIIETGPTGTNVNDFRVMVVED